MVWFVPTLAFADSLSGRIIEAGSSDYGVPGVTVKIMGTSLDATTDAQGQFTFDALPGGTVILVASKKQYISIKKFITPAQRVEPVLLKMTWQGKAKTVKVKASRRRPGTASTTFIGRKMIDAAPHRNAEEILRQVPGLTLVQHGSEGKGHQFFLRGFDAIHGSDLELTLHGMPINEWSNIHAQGYLDLAIIIPEFVRGVMVTKGPFTLSQGAFAMAGSSDYRLGVPFDGMGLHASYTLGTTNRHRLFVGYSPGDGGEFVGLEGTLDAGFGQNRGMKRATLNARKQLFRFKNSSLHLMALGGHGRFELPGTVRNDDVEAGRIGFFETYDDQANGKSTRGLASLIYDWQKDEQQISVTGYGGVRYLNLLENFTGFLIDSVHGDRRNQNHENWSFGLNGQYQTAISSSVLMRAGVGFRGDIFEQREDNVGQGPAESPPEVISTRRHLSGRQLIVHGLAGVQWEPNSFIRFDGGARADLIRVDVVDKNNANTSGGGALLALSPRLTTRLSPHRDLKLFFAYGRGFRPPEARAFSAFDVGRTGGGEMLSTDGPQLTVSDSGEVGMRWQPGCRLKLGLSGFATYIERESIFDHVSGTSLELNGTRRLGGELFVQYEPKRWLSFQADLTLVDARFLDSGNTVPFAPWLVSGVRTRLVPLPNLVVGFRALAVAPRTLPHGATGATLLMTDASVSYKFDVLELGLDIENLLNRQLREGEYHYASDWDPRSSSSDIPVIHTTAGAPFNVRLTLGLVF